MLKELKRWFRVLALNTMLLDMLEEMQEERDTYKAGVEEYKEIAEKTLEQYKEFILFHDTEMRAMRRMVINARIERDAANAHLRELSLSSYNRK